MEERIELFNKIQELSEDVAHLSDIVRNPTQNISKKEIIEWLVISNYVVEDLISIQLKIKNMSRGIITDIHTATMFLENHPSGNFMDALDISYVKVDPATLRVENDKSKDVRTQVWLESGTSRGSHDYRLDCGADTFEEAVIYLSNLVLKYYGDYEGGA